MRLRFGSTWSPPGARPRCSRIPERAALALAEEGARLADAHQGVSDETWADVRKHFNDDEVGTLVALISFINSANRLNVIVRNPPERCVTSPARSRASRPS